MGVTSQHWSRALIESIVTTLLQENQEVNGSLKEHGALQARILERFDIPSPVGHILSELSTMTRPSWVALRGMAHSFIELDKAVVHVISVASFLGFRFSFCLSLMEKGKRFVEAS